MTPDPRALRPAVPLAVLCALDPVLRDAVAADLLLDEPGAVVLRYDTDAARGTMHRLVMDLTGVIERREVELEHACVSCAMREDAVPVLEALAADGRWSSIALVLPVSADPWVVTRALAAQPMRSRISTVATVLDSSVAIEDLLGEDTLAERGLQWAVDDERAVGEALAAQIEFSDVVIDAAEQGGPGRELVQHLLAEEQILVEGVHRLGELSLMAPLHDLDRADARVDVRSVQLHGGPSEHGTWSMELVSDLPFHPERFLENIELLGAGRMRGRGRFWLPTRPQSICRWDGAGGQVSVGVHTLIGPSEEQPSTHLVITGVDPEDEQRVREAFEASLMTRREWQRGLLPWLGVDDGMDMWLGSRAEAA